MKRSTGTTVLSESVELDYVDADGRPASLGADLVYDPQDPFAMSMVFKTSPAVTWTFSRELLMSGIHAPAGTGDVQIRPSPSRGGGGVVTFQFSSPDGQVLVQAEPTPCARFTERMQRCVPVGRELEQVDLDAAISHILGGAPDLQV